MPLPSSPRSLRDTTTPVKLARALKNQDRVANSPVQLFCDAKIVTKALNLAKKLAHEACSDSVCRRLTLEKFTCASEPTTGLKQGTKASRKQVPVDKIEKGSKSLSPREQPRKRGRVQPLCKLVDIPKAAFVHHSSTPVLVEELRPRFPQAPPLNIRVCAERLPTGIEAKGKKVPKTGLVEGSVVIKTYGTLRCHPITHEANTWLTARGVQDLPAQMRFDETYVQHMKNLGLERGRFVNASFAEWLFGFPQGFTLREDSECRPSKCRRLSKSCPLSTSKISAASVFSGCDGLSRGLEDWITVCNYCEVNPVPRELLENKIKRGLLAPAEVESDIREMDGKKLRKQGVRMIVGGFPCQDISISGNMVGFEGQRSSLFYELVRIAEEGRVPWLFLENVAAIVCQSMDGVLTSVLQTLNDKGYSTRYLCLCGNEIGCPMYRRRWFLLAKHKSADVEELRSLVPAPPSHEDWAKEVQRPWNAQAKPPMADWLLPEPTKDNSARLIMLGNAVVPQMSHRAMQLLVHDHCWS